MVPDLPVVDLDQYIKLVEKSVSPVLFDFSLRRPNKLHFYRTNEQRKIIDHLIILQVQKSCLLNSMQQM